MQMVAQKMTMTGICSALSDQQFQKISRIVYAHSGIKLKQGKEALVRSRLMKRLRVLGFENTETYLEYLDANHEGEELGRLIDVITTNKTSFFRESRHFNFLRESVLTGIKKPRLRFWTAACSSGEEPYTLAMVLHETLADIRSLDVRILATDISSTMLQKAARGVYSRDDLEEIPQHLRQRYFETVGNASAMFQIRKSVRDMVKIAWLNLVGNWPMKGPFDAIFCRNVMIYFDKTTQEKLVNRFWHLMEPGSYLFVGHSEGLSGISHRFRYVQPAVYRK